MEGIAEERQEGTRLIIVEWSEIGSEIYVGGVGDNLVHQIH